MRNKKLESALFEYFNEKRFSEEQEWASTYYLLQYFEENACPKVFKHHAIIGAYLNVYDYFPRKPILMTALDVQPKNGKIFKDVFLLTPDTLPQRTKIVIANRRCLMSVTEKHMVTISDRIQFLLSPQGQATLEKCIIAGVYKDNTIHYFRGFDTEEE